MLRASRAPRRNCRQLAAARSSSGNASPTRDPGLSNCVIRLHNTNKKTSLQKRVFHLYKSVNLSWFGSGCISYSM
jgi:hypothetical protein